MVARTVRVADGTSEPSRAYVPGQAPIKPE